MSFTLSIADSEQGEPIYLDTMFVTVPSVHRKTCAQVFTDTEGYDHFYPLKSKQQAGDALHMFVEDTRWIPQTIITDRAQEEIGGSWLTTRKKFQIGQRYTEPYSYWQNRAEDTVREIKKGIKRHTRRSGSPKRLWCFLGEYVAAI